jgi:hypothetical protein
LKDDNPQVLVKVLVPLLIEKEHARREEELYEMRRKESRQQEQMSNATTASYTDCSFSQSLQFMAISPSRHEPGAFTAQATTMPEGTNTKTQPTKWSCSHPL